MLHERSLRLSFSRAATTFTETYLEALLALEPSDVPRAPCFGYGRGGIAYVFLRAGLTAERADLLARGVDWVRAGQRTAARFRLRGWPKRSYSRGFAGLYAIEARLAHARGDHSMRDRAIERFIATCRSARGSVELFQGTAGRLAGTAVLYRSIPDPTLRVLGDELAAKLAAELAHQRVELPRGIAHGWPGVALALLEWEGSGSSHASTLRRALATMSSSETGHPGWASGEAGMAQLFARATTRLADDSWLPIARSYGTRAMRAVGGSSLASGDPGVAYAMLALAEIDNAGPWLEAAHRLASSVLASLEVPDDSPWGVWSGLSGVYCLVADMLHGRSEFPGVSA